MAEEEINNCIAGCTNSIKNEKKNVDESLNVQRVDEFQDEQNVETRHTKNILDGSSYCASELTEAVPGSSKGTTKGGPSDQTTVWLPETSFKAEAEDVFNLPEREGGEESEIEEETEEERLKEESNVEMLAETGFKAEAEDEFSLPKREVSEESENNEESEEESDVEIEVGSSEGAYHLAEVSYGEENKECEQAGGSRPNSALIMSADHFMSAELSVTPSKKVSKVRSNKSKGLLSSHITVQTIILKKSVEITNVNEETTQIIQYKCPHCTYNSQNKRTVVEHTYKHLGVRPHQCSECGMGFTNASYLREHRRITHIETPYDCKLCGRKCGKKSALDKHLRVHTREKPYSCEVCDYKSAQQNHVKEHMRRHTGEKPYSCPKCEYRCAYSALLKRHMDRHTGEIFPCALCNYTSKTYRSLQAHVKNHSTETPFGCDYCGKNFRTRDAVKHHIRNIHLYNEFKCDQCHRIFKRKFQLKLHMNGHTGGEKR